MTKPITPSEAMELKGKLIPDFVFECVNKIIAKYYYPKRIFTFKQDELMKTVIDAMNRIPEYREMTDAEMKREVYDNHWFDFEQIYIEHGWDVSYDSEGKFFRFKERI